MDASDLRAHQRHVACVQGHRWLGPRANKRIRQSRTRRRARAQRLLRRWVSEHAAGEVPTFATWMLSANVPGADRALAWFRDAIELPLARDSWRTSQDRLIAADIAHQTTLDEDARGKAAAAKFARAAVREGLIKARYQASEEEDLLLLEFAERNRAKIQEHVEERLHLWGNAAV